MICKPKTCSTKSIISSLETNLKTKFRRLKVKEIKIKNGSKFTNYAKCCNVIAQPLKNLIHRREKQVKTSKKQIKNLFKSNVIMKK